MKKLNILLISFIIVIIFTLLPVSATEYDSDVVVALQINNPIMEVNGIQTEIDSGRGTTPIVNSGRTLVPIRAIIESFNGTVSWDESTQTVSLNLFDDNITLTIGKSLAYLNGSERTLDVHLLFITNAQCSLFVLLQRVLIWELRGTEIHKLYQLSGIHLMIMNTKA